MPCAPFEGRLLDYDELSAQERTAVDGHLPGCAACREYLDMLRALDARLTSLYAGAHVSPTFRSSLAGKMLHKPSLWPEVLDFLGWAAVITCILLFVLLMPALFPPALITALIAAGSAAAWIGLRAFRELDV
jgi:anti-sigma factor RsiW